MLSSKYSGFVPLSKCFTFAILHEDLTDVCGNPLTSFPPLENTADWSNIMKSFERCHGIPWVVGAIDGTHIPIIMPPDYNWKSYDNRKSWPSIVFQCVVDGDGNFRNVSFPLVPYLLFPDSSPCHSRSVEVAQVQFMIAVSSGNLP